VTFILAPLKVNSKIIILMKTNLLFLSSFYLCSLIACRGDGNNQPLFGNIDLTVNSDHATSISSLFGTHFKVTCLETSVESLIGQIDKIVKRNSYYYILSDNVRIHKFDSAGRFIAKLDARGRGAGEYSRIEDFDVYAKDGEEEVWISDMHQIKIYRAQDFSYKRLINFAFIINKFKKTPSDKILILTGQREKMLTLADQQGQILADFQEQQAPFALLAAIPFRLYDQKLVFSLGNSNSCVVYDDASSSFEKRQYARSNILSESHLMSLYTEHKENYIRHLKDYHCLRYFQQYAEGTYVSTLFHSKRYLFRVDAVKGVSGYAYDKIKNDILGSIPTDFLNTFGFTESDDSLLLCWEAPDASGSSLPHANSQKIDVREGDNPILIDFFLM
jgi:hypothetical protein